MGRLTDVIRGQVRPELEMAAVATKALGPVGLQGAIAMTLIALPIGDKACLFQFDQQAAGEEATPTLPFVSIGSGGHNGDVFLAFLRRTFWLNNLPSVADGSFAAVWCLFHAISIDPGGVGGDIVVATLMKDAKWKATLLETDEIAEHVQAVNAAEEYLRGFKQQLGGSTTDEVLPPTPEPPKP